MKILEHAQEEIRPAWLLMALEEAEQDNRPRRRQFPAKSVGGGAVPGRRLRKTGAAPWWS